MSPCVRIDHGVLCLAGPTYRINVEGRVYTFEWHAYCGPAVVSTITGDPLSLQPTKFLTAAGLWDTQGRRLDARGFCRWEPAPEIPPGYRLVRRGRHRVLVPIAESARPPGPTRAEPGP